MPNPSFVKSGNSFLTFPLKRSKQGYERWQVCRWGLTNNDADFVLRWVKMKMLEIVGFWEILRYIAKTAHAESSIALKRCHVDRVKPKSNSSHAWKWKCNIFHSQCQVKDAESIIHDASEARVYRTFNLISGSQLVVILVLVLVRWGIEKIKIRLPRVAQLATDIRGSVCTYKTFDNNFKHLKRSSKTPGNESDTLNHARTPFMHTPVLYSVGKTNRVLKWKTQAKS